MSNKFYKKRKKDYTYKYKLIKKNYINTKNTIKFCVFAGRKSNIQILHKYIEILLNENIINEYHIFDFTRNLKDKENLLIEYIRLNKIYINRIFIYNYDQDLNIENNQFDWSPFYKKISKKKFYKNSTIIKCDDDILFIDVYGLKNAINERIKDKKSFIIHSNCINNNVCTYFQKDLFNSITEKLNIYPKGGILGSTFENPTLSYIIQYQFLKDCLNDINNIKKYFLKDIYINTRISINFILLNGEDCKYFKNTSFNDEYELSSYYPEKFLRPNKIIGNFITCHYSYSLQENLLSKKKDIKMMYEKLYNKYNQVYKNLNINFINENLNNFKINKLSHNKFYVSNNLYKKYSITTNEKNLYINYKDNHIYVHKNKKTYFDIKFIEDHKIIISIGIYKFSRYNIIDEFKNRNLLIKMFNDISENVIELIPNSNLYYLRFLKNKLYLSLINEKLSISEKPITLWNFQEYLNKDKIYLKRYSKNKKFYYKNLKTNHNFTNFYLGWGNENIIDIY